MRWKVLIIGWMVCLSLVAQTDDGFSYGLSEVLEDIYNQLAEAYEIPMEDLTEQLMDIAANPIDLNQTNSEELRKLCWLSDEQIDELLLYAYQHPFESVYELQLIHSLKDYEIRNLLPFVKVEGRLSDEAKGRKKMYFREIFHYAKHEITLRTDARNIEDFEGDPMYGKLRYRFDYQNKVQAGWSIVRPTGEPIKNLGYGGFVQLQDIACIKNLSVGNFQANFGEGLVVGSPFKMGKTSYVSSRVNAQEGVRKFTAIGDDYQAFHGIGTTLRFSWAEVSGFYSIQREDSVWHHLVGMNATGRWKKLKLGITALENLYSDSTQAKAVVGMNARYNWGRVDLWGEVAATQGSRWGWGGIAGVTLRPISDVYLMALYRYYSPYFDNPYAYAFSEKSRLNDESGFYIGTEVKRVPHWRFAAYVDAFRVGYDAMLQADFIPNSIYDMYWRVRARKQIDKDTYALRYRFAYRLAAWKFRTQLDANLVKTEQWSYGVSLLQDIEYQLSAVPIVLQLRLQAFDARQWNNRIYTYENDVLYAYSIPNVYGLGGRLWLNARYKINEVLSVYLRVSETLYQAAWAEAHDKKSTRTDVHALLRVKL